MKGPILKGERVTLRPIKLSDAPKFITFFKDKEVVKYLLFQPDNLTLRFERKWISDSLKDKEKITWAIVYNEQIIGSTELRLINQHKFAILGILIGDKTKWDQGFGSEVIILLANYLFKKLKYNRLELGFAMNNKRALKAYKKVGFKLEGVQRKKHWNKISRCFEDEDIMSILREEWFKKYKK